MPGVRHRGHHLPHDLTGAAHGEPANMTLSTDLHAQPGQLHYDATLYLPEYGGIPYEFAATTRGASTPGARPG